jgi:hypothetical protein
VAAWPDLATYKAWARIEPTDTVNDTSITASLDAATAAVLSRCPALSTDAECPDDVAEAVLLWTNRLVARRNSPTGVVGIDETGQALVPGRDPDIAKLLSPWREQVLG